MFKNKYFILALIILTGAFLRFYLLSAYPVQLNHDEVSQIYDASSIMQTKKDIYGNFLPLAFPSTGDFKVGHYIYITLLPYLIFGDKEFTVRIPSAFFGTLIIPAIFLFVVTLTKKWNLAILSAALIAITPSEIFYARKSFENVIGIFFVFIGLFFLFKQLEQRKIKLSSFLAPFTLAIPMYLYTAHTIVVPLIVVLFGIFFRRRIKYFKKKFILIFVVWILFLIPLIYLVMTNEVLRFRASSVSITGDINLAKRLDYVKTGNSIISGFYQYKTIFDYGFTRYLNQFNPVYIFANGLDITHQGDLGLGPLMLWQLPFVILGLILIIKSINYRNNYKFILCLSLLAFLPSAITFEPLSPHRSVMAFSIISVISAFGVYQFIQIQKKFISYKFITAGGYILIVFSLTFNLIYAMQLYTINFPYEKSQYMHYPFKQLSQYVWSQYNYFDQIIVDPNYGQSAPSRAVATQYYLAYYGNYPPAKLQEKLEINTKGMSFDKFYIRQINWTEDQNLKKTLIIASPWQLPIESLDKSKILKTFYFYDHQVAFYAVKP